MINNFSYTKALF